MKAVTGLARRQGAPKAMTVERPQMPLFASTGAWHCPVSTQTPHGILWELLVATGPGTLKTSDVETLMCQGPGSPE